MDDDLNLDLDNIEANAENKIKAKNRFEQLSEKVILTSQEKEKAEALAKTNEERAIKAEKERDFHKDFSANVAKYPNASEFQDKILEKVNAGYSTEDAMVAVLAKEGKLQMPTESRPAPQAEGGSAPTTMEGPKDIKDMSPEEKFEALKELDKTGELASAIRGGR